MPRRIPLVLDNRRADKPAPSPPVSGLLVLPLFVLMTIQATLGVPAYAQVEKKGAGTSSGQTRLAVVPLTSGESLPPEFSALLAVDLSQSPDVALLERERVDRLLKEQALSLSLGPEDNRANLVKAGEILAADALLLVALDKKDNAPESMLRVRLVETRQGFKLLDWNLAFPSDRGKYEETAKTLAGRTRRYLAGIEGDPQSRLMIGVSVFTSDELSWRWDWLARAIPPAVEQNLLLYPGVILMERFAAKPLMDERDLARDLPESIRASAILIGGSYRIENQNQTLGVTLVARRGGREVFREKVEGPVSDHEAVCAQAARAILTNLRSRPVEPSMDAEAEAAMLVAEVESLFARGEGARALPIAESAAALAPNSPKCQMVLQKAFMYTMLPLREPGVVAQSFPRLGAITSRIVSVATPFESVQAIQGLMNLARNVLEWLDRQPAMADSYREVRLLQQEFYRIALRICMDKGIDKIFITPYADIAHSLTIEEAMDLAAEIEADRPKWQQGNALSPLGGVVMAMQRWKDDAEACKKGEAFLARLCESSHMGVRFEALRALEYYYQEVRRDYPQVRAIARRILDTQKSLGVVNPPSFALTSYSADRQESRRFEAELLTEAFTFIYEEKKNSKVPKPGIFVQDQLFYVVNLLEEVGRKEDAKKWLNLSLESYGDWQGEYWQQVKDRLLLLEGKPLDVREKNTQEPPPALIPKRLLTAAGLSDGMPFFRRMLIHGGEIVLVVSPVSDREYRLLRVDRKTLAVRSVTAAGKATDDIGPDTWGQERWNALTVAMHNEDVFLGTVSAGILVFRGNGGIEYWTEKSGLACQRVRDLQSLGDRLFAHAGTVWQDSGLMEIDPLTGKSRMFLSSKSVGQSELDGRFVHSIQADPTRGVLWITLAGQEGGPIKRAQLYQYDPRAAAFQQVKTNLLQEVIPVSAGHDHPHRMRLFGKHLLMCGIRGIYQMNVDTREDTILRFLTGGMYLGQWQFPWEYRWDITMRTNVLAGENLVTHEGNRMLVFHPSSQSPVLLHGALFDAEKDGKLVVRDLIPAPEGLYVLTENALYRIAGIQGPPIGKDEILVP